MAGRFSVEAVFKAVDRVTAPVRKMQNGVGKFTRGMERQLRRINRTLGKFTGALGTAARKALVFGGGAAVAGITAVALALNKTADAADRLAKQSRRLQFPIEELQEWKFVAEQSGVSNELLDKSLGAFTKRLGEAKGGMGPLVTGLKNINPKLLEQLKATDNVAQAFEMYVDAMRGAESATERAALANAAFSRAGLELANIADNSSTAIAALRKEQRQNGNITMQQAEAAEAYNDAINSLKRSLMGLLQGVLLPMLPAITETVRAWRDWVVANREMVQGRIMQWFQNLKTQVMGFIETLRQANQEQSILERLGNILEKVANVATVIGQNAPAILKMVAAVVALSLAFKAVAAVLGVINVLTAANPIALAIMAAVAAVGLLTGALDPVVEVIKNIWEGIKSVASIAGSFLGFGSDEDEQEQRGARGANVVSPQERVARQIEEQRTTTTAEVTLKDETGRAEVTGGALGNGVALQPSGAF